MATQPTFLCLADEFKGADFLRELKALGCTVFLLTNESLRDEAWPREALDDLLLMPHIGRQPDVTNAVSYLARQHRFDRIVALDDFDVLTTADLREHLRLPGMGHSTARRLRDKLAMRVAARSLGVPVPAFTGLFHDESVNLFLTQIEPPWMLKPRLEAGAVGIKKLDTPDAVWAQLHSMGDQRSHYLLEQFVPGQVFHVDSLLNHGNLIFQAANRYGQPPFDVAQGGGVFRTQTLPPDTDEAQQLLALNAKVVPGLGLRHGVAHTEFIRAADGQFCFLEIGARVAGANIPEMLAAARGLNLWQAWARMEVADFYRQPYQLPPLQDMQAGLLICLARQEWPDLHSFDAPEVVWRLNKAHHAGLVVAGPDAARIDALLDTYAHRLQTEFMAVAPPLASSH